MTARVRGWGLLTGKTMRIVCRAPYRSVVDGGHDGHGELDARCRTRRSEMPRLAVQLQRERGPSTLQTTQSAPGICEGHARATHKDA